MSDLNDWHQLIDRHLRGELSESEKEHLAEQLDSHSAARKDFVEEVRWDTRFAEVLRESSDRGGKLGQPNTNQDADAIFVERTPSAHERTATTTFTRTLLAIALVTIVALTASLYIQRPSVERKIAGITGLSGSLQWTGDGGQVFHDLSVGTELAGGTIEGMTPGSWFELEFNDGSTVTISGNSMLTFSDHGQKELHLKEGNMAGNVKPQAAGKPMLIYTRSAMLEVVGTQFEVEAGLAATMLNVSQGKVRVKRFSDGSTVDVPAKHRLIAAADREMSPVPVPDSVSRWKSQLHLGPHGTQGIWSPETDAQDARLRAIPYTTPQGKTIYTAAFGVSRGDKPPVILQPASRLRVRGRIASTHKVYFGVTLRHPNGEFAGNFQTIRPAVEFPGGEDFEAVLLLGDFRLDPSLDEMKNKLPGDPFGLVIESFWCHTLNEQAGLEVTEVELIPPAEYCEKPMGRDIHEVRVATQVAGRYALATQLGNGAHSGYNYRSMVALIKAGTIGEVKEVHTWCDQAWAPGDRPKATPPVPKYLKWDLWLGPAPVRPYHPCYHPQAWRNWWDFGNGRLGDMGCHMIDLPFSALDLKYPLTVETEGPKARPDG